AETVAREALALAKPDADETRAGCYLVLGKAAARRGNLAEAAREFEQGLARTKDLRLRSDMTVRLIRSGGARQALPYLKQLCE
ncbi:hypothetical protein, partial [Vibrio cholerae]|uniref:hypothetical protein n=1 Tax=Vibrio cholerae TaxID=666 RepID=UPI00301B830D